MKIEDLHQVSRVIDEKFLIVIMNFFEIEFDNQMNIIKNEDKPASDLILHSIEHDGKYLTLTIFSNNSKEKFMDILKLGYYIGRLTK